MELFDKKIDVRALRAKLNETAASITKIKRSLRTTWTRPMADEQRALWALKDRATELCVLRAYLRGKHHLAAPRRRGWYPGKVWDAQKFHRELAAAAADRHGLIVAEARSSYGGAS